MADEPKRGSERGKPAPKRCRKKQPESPKSEDKPICFVIMPIGELPDRPPNHFVKIYRQILKPACVQAGYRPIRGDDVRQTNDIHVDVLNKLLHAPMALCDLSGLNPNVLFELGIRQAFNKPVVLVREVGTKTIFDIGSLRYTDYRKNASTTNCSKTSTTSGSPSKRREMRRMG